MTIRFLYFEGCPHAGPSLASLEKVMDRLPLGARLEVVVIADQEEAAREGFLGSPSVLVEGLDLETGDKPGPGAFTCRLYDIEGRKTGILTESYLEERLRALVSARNLRAL